MSKTLPPFLARRGDTQKERVKEEEEEEIRTKRGCMSRSRARGNKGRRRRKRRMRKGAVRCLRLLYRRRSHPGIT